MNGNKHRLVVIYDGDCPFCSRYVRLARLRDSFDIELVDARARQDVVAELRSSGYDLDAGMVVRLEGKTYHGADAMWLLSTLSSKSGLWNRVLAAMFRNRRLAGILYPVLRAGRNLTLRLLGRKPLH
ncbi:MAG: thiol-disulfide oxidoreductase DCC family protein [Porticoccaceae bacterium]